MHVYTNGIIIMSYGCISYIIQLSKWVRVGHFPQMGLTGESHQLLAKLPGYLFHYATLHATGNPITDR